MYSLRVVAFVDILGFGALVERSTDAPELQRSISEALSSISPASIHGLDIVRVNSDVVPPEEIERVREIASQASRAFLEQHPLVISYFSDCLVISASADDFLACQMILHTLSSLSVRIWTDHHLTLRGGITAGYLHHEQGALLFGPAMNRAYELESKHANFPRVILDSKLVTWLRGSPNFHLMDTVLEDASDYTFMSIATCLHHMVTSSSWTLGADDYYDRCYAELTGLPDRLTTIRQNHSEPRTIEKYDWLIIHSNSVLQRTTRRQ